MHLHAPARSRNLGGQPEYHAPSGKAIATLGRLELVAEPDGSWTIGGFWCHRQSVARGYWLQGRPLAECCAWAERWVANPEAAMAELGWVWEGRSSTGVYPLELDVPRSSVSLDDLGL